MACLTFHGAHHRPPARAHSLLSGLLEAFTWLLPAPLIKIPSQKRCVVSTTKNYHFFDVAPYMYIDFLMLCRRWHSVSGGNSPSGS